MHLAVVKRRSITIYAVNEVDYEETVDTLFGRLDAEGVTEDIHNQATSEGILTTAWTFPRSVHARP